MLCASAVLFAVMFLLAVSSSVNMPTVAPSVLVRTIISVLVQTAVPALGHTIAVLFPFGNPIMSLDLAATTSPMVLYRSASMAEILTETLEEGDWTVGFAEE
ncbi:hypothetical protein DFP73DRAFT_601065 [Morchella snyderi]|nr:hypothetical protein DFP73DRAFT_601065 [Morchella snyderi]